MVFSGSLASPSFFFYYAHLLLGLCPASLGNPTGRDRYKEAENADTTREANIRGKTRARGKTRGKGSTGRNRHWHCPNANSRCWLVFAFLRVTGAGRAPNAVGSEGSAHELLRTDPLLSIYCVAERTRGPLGLLKNINRKAAS